MMILFTATMEDENAKYFMGKILERFAGMAMAARRSQTIRNKVTILQILEIVLRVGVLQQDCN